MDHILSKGNGGHDYPGYGGQIGRCLFGCGSQMGTFDASAPPGIDAFNHCPRNPLNLPEPQPKPAPLCGQSQDDDFHRYG